MEWEQPHWSGRPRTGAPRQKLRPNGFARMVRWSAEQRFAVIGLSLLLALLCGGFAATTLEIDPDQGPRITLDEKTFLAQAELDKRFPGIDQTFLAIVESREAETARAQAVALAASLAERGDLFISSFVPGTGVFYDSNALLYHDIADVRGRVDAALQMQPLYQAIAAAPDVLGLVALVSEIGKAVEQGRSPPGLEALLLTASATIEAEVRGSSRPINWPVLAGLAGETQSLRWFVIATPKPGSERMAASVARQAADGMQGVRWLWPRRALGSNANPLRDFVVPAGLSAFITLTLLGAGLGSFRLTFAIIVPGAVTLALAAAVAAGMGQALDGATWSFAAAVLAPVILMGVVLTLSYTQGRARGLPVLQAMMLAAQRRGGMISGFAFLFLAFWLSWLVRQLPSLSQFAVIAIIGAVIAWIATLTLLPAMIMLLDRTAPEPEPHWLDEVLDDGQSYHTRNALDVVAMIVLAAAVFSAAFLPGVRFGERQVSSAAGLFLETPDARGAIHVLVRPEAADAAVAALAKLPEVGAIRTITQFMPPGAAEKISVLRRLETMMPTEPVPRNSAEATVLSASFEELDGELTAISVGPATTPALRDAALRLKRAVNLFAGSTPPTEARVAALEDALFSGLGELSRASERLSRLAEPRIGDLDPLLRQRFVAGDGMWRIEVMPKTDVGLLSFAAAARRAMPAAAGEPVTALVRNEIIHHETLLALAAAFVAATILVLAVLKNVSGWVLSLTPVSALVTLTAAASVLMDVGLNTAMLAGGSAVAAVLIGCSMVAAEHLTGQHKPSHAAHSTAMRAAILPPVVLAGAVAPLAISSRPAVAELGAIMALMLLTATVLSLLLIPAAARWLRKLTG